MRSPRAARGCTTPLLLLPGPACTHTARPVSSFKGEAVPRAQTELRATANSTQQCLGPQRGCATEARARSLQGLGSPRWRSPFWQCHVKSCARALGQPSASRCHRVPRALEVVWKDRLGRGGRSRPQLSHRRLVWQLQVRTSATSRRFPSSEQAWLVGLIHTEKQGGTHA